MHARRSIFVLMLSLFVGGPAAWATTVYVTPAEFRGNLGEDAATITDLLKNAVDKTKGFDDVESNAKAQITLTARVMKLGSAYLVSVKRTDGLKPAAELKVANMEDMHLASQRLVRTVLTGAVEAPQVGEVTESDVHGNDRRIEATRQFQLAFGPAWTSNLRNPGPASVWSVGYLWGIEQDYEIQLLGEFLSSSKSKDVSFGGFSIGLNYLFTRTRNAPFVTADFGYGWASADRGCEGGCSRLSSVPTDDVNGWQLGAGLGYKFFRTANVNLAVIAHYEYMMATTRQGMPSKTSLKVALYF